MTFKTVSDVMRAARKRKLRLVQLYQIKPNMFRANFATYVPNVVTSRENPIYFDLYEGSTVFRTLRGAYRIARHGLESGKLRGRRR